MSATPDIVILQEKLSIRPEYCKGCAFCVEFCPKKVLFMSEGFNSKGYHPPGVDPEAKCTNCKLCELLCPEFAIYSLDIGLKKGAAANARPGGSTRAAAAEAHP
jgi:2-oxoglutarate ferredoxin oxidoreductase subunit delta